MISTLKFPRANHANDSKLGPGDIFPLETVAKSFMVASAKNGLKI